MKVRKGMVQRAPVMDEVEARIGTLEVGLNEESKLIALGLRAKVCPGSIYHVIKRRNDTMDFDIADRLFCALGIAHLWWTKLAGVYAEVDLSGPSRVPLWEPTYEDYVCQEKSCGVTFQVITNAHLHKRNRVRKYCSASCSSKRENPHAPKPRLGQRPDRLFRPKVAA